MNIPVYVMAGFLDAGKTRFINGALEDGLAATDRTLLLCCEEGEEEYDPLQMRNVTVVNVEDEEELTKAFLKECEKKHRPRQVVVEYNGMWSLDTLWLNLPDNWFIVQTFSFIEAATFENYARNMAQQTMEKVTKADVLVLNRCTPQLAETLRGRNLRMVNRRAQIYLEYPDGSSEDYLTGEESPFDLDQEVIDIPPEDFGVWYVDVMDHPDRYEGRKLHTKVQMMRSAQYPGTMCPGRFAMVCCADDIAFLGLLAKGEMLKQYKNKQWIEVTYQVGLDTHPAYGGAGPVMEMLEAAPCDKVEPEILTY